MFQKLHELWERNELTLDLGILAVSVAALFLLASIPQIAIFPSLNIPLPQGEGGLEGRPRIATEEFPPLLIITLPQASNQQEESFSALVSPPQRKEREYSPEELSMLQEITRTNQEISRLKSLTLQSVIDIQKACGGQQNACAKERQAALQDRAQEYDAAQERLRLLTASLGNLGE